MSWQTAGEIDLAVRVRNARYDGMITGWLHDIPTFDTTDPGGFASGSFTVDQRLGFNSAILLPYSRIYYYDKCTGECVFEGDMSHPGKASGSEGPLLEVQVEGGKDRTNDWKGARIYIDRDMDAWKKDANASIVTEINKGEDRGGSGADALNLNFPMDTHVELNYRAEALYDRIREAGQVVGWFNYAWDGGHTSGSPGWLVRSLASPPSTVVRSQILNVGGSGGSGAVWGGSIPDGATSLFLQLIWTSGSSSTGTSGNDICWASILRPQVQAKFRLKDGTFRLAGSYSDNIDASVVINDLLGDQLAPIYDGPNARIDAGAGNFISQMAYPDGTSPSQVLEDCMIFEPAMTWRVGASNVANDKYSFEWIVRPTEPRYEALLWTDQHSNGTQEVDQYNRAVARWRSPVGNLRITVATQTIPEMDAVGRVRTFWQDLSNTTGDEDNAPAANASVLEQHRYPANSGVLTIDRPIVDLLTGRRVRPWEIRAGELVRLVGIDPNADALNAAGANGGTVCRIVNTKCSGTSVACDLDGIPLSMLRAIAATKVAKKPPTRRV